MCVFMCMLIITEMIEAKPSESCLDKWYELSYEPRTGMCAHSGLNSLSLKEVINSFKSELSRRSEEESFFSTII